MSLNKKKKNVRGQKEGQMSLNKRKKNVRGWKENVRGQKERKHQWELVRF